VDPKYVGYRGMEVINLVVNRDHWRIFVVTTMNGRQP